MSDLVNVDCAFFPNWVAIFSLYTTLLTVTALYVDWILRKWRSSILKSQRPARTLFSELELNVATPTDTAKSRRVSFSKRNGVARKWRSLILKSQRPARTPFSELELNVATPTDTAKSRRVSFSKRNGVARKWRSLILKSQRPARTPFSELELNVATPTDTAKSRRVSFSKRNGVAEFGTNETTTTWKNFYEEHYKSLESSGNDSEANASLQPVANVGKRILDQQFQEVEAVDFMTRLANGSLNVNFSQQPISLECIEGKLTAPNNKFELSAFTEQSKLFGDDFTAPSLGEGSGPIDVNFSAIQQVEKDDLDEFEKDSQRGSNSMGCLGPFSDRPNMCEYIEVDLNMTEVVKNDEDMSFTDTVHSPVQDVSKSTSIDKKAITGHGARHTGFQLQRDNNFEEKKLHYATLVGDIDTKSGSLTEFFKSDVLFTSSKDLKSKKDVVSTENMDWHPDLMEVTSSSQCNSGVNVVAKIDMLPFMGSHECKWEKSSSIDKWSFRLLHEHLRLSARLAHRVDNATHTLVRGATPVLDITVDAVQHDLKYPIATMCIRFGCESMRHMVTRALRKKCLARDIPPLLGRCAAVVRVALRWSRAMHNAKLHLAFNMDNDGNLSLKVANIPLRSVWEVTMRIELVLDDKHSVLCPRATNVRVLPIVSDVLVADADVQRALSLTPKDWGHAPRTIWRVFRFLKDKKRDDDLIILA